VIGHGFHEIARFLSWVDGFGYEIAQFQEEEEEEEEKAKIN
jgi:hypothetical protein